MVSTDGHRPPTPLACTYEGATGQLRHVRADVVAWLDRGGAGVEAQERAALVVSELAANAVQAAPGRRFDVGARWDGGHVVVTVRNATDGDRPPHRDAWGPVDALAPRGRGLAIVDALAEGVQIDDDGTDVVVTARLRVDGDGRAR